MRKTGLLKRGLALALAVATVATTWSVDWNMLNVKAADSMAHMPSGSSIAQYYVNNTGAAATVTGASFTVSSEAGSSISFSSSAYINPDPSNPVSGVGPVDCGGSGSEAMSGGEQNVGMGLNIPLAAGEGAWIITTISSDSADGYFDIYPGTEGGSGFHSGAGYFSPCAPTMSGISVVGGATLPSASLNDLPTTTVFLNQGDTYTLSPSLSPAYSRVINYSLASGSSVSVNGNQVTATATGQSVVSVSGDGITAPANVTFMVVNAEVTGTYTYNGGNQNPTIQVNNAPINTSQFTINHGNQKNAGTGSVTITGRSGEFSGFSTTLEYPIAPADLSSADVQAAFEGGDYNVDISTGAVSGTMRFGGSVHTAGTDFDAASRLAGVTENSDGTATYSYFIDITGSGNFTGNYTLTKKITAQGDSNDIHNVYDMFLPNPNLLYDNGNPIDAAANLVIVDKEGEEISYTSIPGVKVSYYYGTTLLSGAPTDVGTYEVRISSSQYTGYLAETFRIKRSLRDATVSIEKEVWVYNGGNEIRPTPSVFLGTQPLVEGVDYTVSWSNNTGITDNAHIIIRATSTGNYHGTLTKDFTIVPNAAEDLKVRIGASVADANNNFRSNHSVTYDGSEREPRVTVNMTGIDDPLEQGVDYTLSFEDNKNAGTAKVIITLDEAKYSAQSITATFTIKPYDISKATFTINDNGSLVYTRNPITLINGDPDTGYELKANGETLIEKDALNPDAYYDYEVSYDNNTNVGPAVMKVTGHGNYTGSTEGHFGIHPRDINDVNIYVNSATGNEDIPDVAYTGQGITPTISLYYDHDGDGTGELIDPSTEGYTVSYQNNTAVSSGSSKAKVILSGNANFKGERIVEFNIIPRTLFGYNMEYLLSNQSVGRGTDVDEDGYIDSNFTMEYTGYERFAPVAVRDGNKTLDVNVDYAITYNAQNLRTNITPDDATRAQLPTVTVTGLNTYANETVNITYRIVPRSIQNDAIRVTRNADGTFTVKDGARELTGYIEGEEPEGASYDYLIKPSTATGGGEKTGTITGYGNYTGTKTFTYEVGYNLANATVQVADKTAGNMISADNKIVFCGISPDTSRPEIRLFTGGNSPQLIDASHYEINWGSEPLDVNSTFNVTITGKGDDYYGTKTFTYRMTQASITPYEGASDPKQYHRNGVSVSCTLPAASFKEETATGSEAIVGGGTVPAGATIYVFAFEAGKTIDLPIEVSYHPTVGTNAATINAQPMVLTKGSHYLVPGTGKVDLSNTSGIFDVRITGQHNFSGERHIYYRVAKPNLSESSDVVMTPNPIPDQMYTGSPIEFSDYTLKNVRTNEVLVQDRDYTVRYEGDTTNPGTVTIVFTGQGVYDGELRVTYEIKKRPITDFHLSDIPDQEYTGTAITITPEPQLLDADGNVVPNPGGNNYRYTYVGNHTLPGLATLRVTATDAGPYSGTFDQTFVIYKNLEASMVEGISDGTQFDLAADGKLTYKSTTDELKDRIMVKLGSATLTSGTNYRISTQGMTTPGKGGTVTITGDGTYYRGAVVFSDMEVFGQLSDATWVPSTLAQQYYTGAQITPPVPTLRYGAVSLVPGVDYETPLYGANKEVGAGNGSITVTGKGYYSGSKSILFDIVYNLNDASITGVLPSYTYDGSDKKPEPVVKIDNTTLNPGTDYELIYSTDTKSIGQKFVTVRYKDGRSVGMRTIPYEITPIQITDDNTVITITAPSTFIYNGKEQRATGLNVTVNGTSISESEYRVSYDNNVDATAKSGRKARLTITGLGNYQGSTTVEFDIHQKNINTFIPEITDVYYTGSAAKPTYTLADPDRGVMIEDVDYTAMVQSAVSVQNDVPVTFTGIGNYTGQTSGTFNILKTDIANATVRNNTAEYTGSPIIPGSGGVPDVVVTLGDSTLNKSEYTITFGGGSDMVNVGTYSMTITPKNSSSVGGELLSSYEVTQRSIASTGNYVDPIPDQKYTGAPVTPFDDVKVYDSKKGTYLVRGQDYEVSFINNEASAYKNEPVPPTAIITGINNYSGELRQTFSIGENLASARVVTGTTDFTYNGRSQIPTIQSVILTITDPATGATEDKLLRAGIDYRVETYDEDTVNASPAAKTIYITGAGTGYFGMIPVQYFIHPKVALKRDMRYTLNLARDRVGYYAYYTGVGIEPTITIYDITTNSAVPLREGVDYNLRYENNIDVSRGTSGTPDMAATVWVDFKGNYADDADNHFYETFRILPRQLGNDFEVHFRDGLNGRYRYTGTEIEPDFYVTTTDITGAQVILQPYDETTNTGDYKASFSDNINAGPGKITITGIGDFEGSITKEFEIWASLWDAEITIPTQPYTGKLPTPTATVICGGNTLEQGKDFNIAVLPDPTDPGYYTVSGLAHISSEGKYYTDDVTVQFDIEFDENNYSIHGLNPDGYQYTGASLKPNITVQDQNGTKFDLVSVEYHSNVDGSACIDVGIVTVTAKVRIGERLLTLTSTYQIVPRDIATVTMRAIQDRVYTGTDIEPTIALYDTSFHSLVKGRDYKVTYAYNRYPGVASVTIEGIGNYNGKRYDDFNITLPSISGLSVSANGQTSATLRWVGNSLLSGYRITYVKNGQTQTVMLNNSTTVTAVVEGLSAGTTYAFNVTGFLNVGNRVYYTNTLTEGMTTGLGQTTVTLSSTTAKRATISYTTVTGATGYMIYRSTSANGTYSKIATMPARTLSFIDEFVSSGKTYYYRVRPFNLTNGVYSYGEYSVPKAITVK